MPESSFSPTSVIIPSNDATAAVPSFAEISIPLCSSDSSVRGFTLSPNDDVTIPFTGTKNSLFVEVLILLSPVVVPPEYPPAELMAFFLLLLYNNLPWHLFRLKYLHLS